MQLEGSVIGGAQAEERRVLISITVNKHFPEPNRGRKELVSHLVSPLDPRWQKADIEPTQHIEFVSFDFAAHLL